MIRRSLATALVAVACATERPAPPEAPRPSPEPAEVAAPPATPDAALDASPDAAVVSDAQAAAETGPPDDWPSDVPWLEGARVISEQSTPTVTRLAITRSTKDSGEVMAAWITTAKAAGYDVRENAEEDSATLSRNGTKAWISVQSWGGTSYFGRFGRASHAPQKLPGACSKIPERGFSFRVQSTGIDQEGEIRSGETSWRIETVHLADVDADGELDAFVPLGPARGKCPWELPYRVYVVRGGCGHVVGDVGPGFVAERTADEPAGPGGFRAIDLESSWADSGPRGIPQHMTRTLEYIFTNGRYRKVKDDTRAGICHHCAVSSCFFEP